MTYAYTDFADQPEGLIRSPQRQSTGGHAIGIVGIEIYFPILPGSVVNATTYDFPVLFKVLRGVGPAELMSGDPALKKKVIEAGQELVRNGARAVVGAGGSFAYFQQAMVRALEVPTFMSILTQVPFILQSLAPSQRLGILYAVESAFTDRIMEECGIPDRDRLVIIGAQDGPEFSRLLRGEGVMDSAALESELVGLATQAVADHPDIGAFLLQCSEFPTYAHAIQNAVHRPIFDMALLIAWLHRALVRRPFAGYL